jgi:hypothetical protein
LAQILLTNDAIAVRRTAPAPMRCRARDRYEKPFEAMPQRLKSRLIEPRSQVPRLTIISF